MLAMRSVLTRSGVPAVCRASSSAQTGEAAGDNVLGQSFKKAYEIGQASTIRWGVVKRPVVPPAGQSWEQYRTSTEPRRKELRQQFADNLEVISYAERDRRRNVGILVAVLTAAAATFLAAQGAPWTSRLWLYPGIAFGVAFIDSARLGLCTESMAGAWDVDDTGLEFMPTLDLARKIQQKVIGMYFKDAAIAVGLLAICCKL